MNPYLKVALGTVIPLGILAGTALSASAGQVKIELINVYCGDTEDVTGADEFYIVGALTDGTATNTKAALTSPISINNGQTKTFSNSQKVLFNGYVAQGTTIRGGLKAYDEDWAHDWAQYEPWATKIKDAVVTGLNASGNPKAVTAATILNYGYKAFSALSYLDKDDLLGTLELNVSPIGPNVEEKTWKFSKSDWTGYSSWNYTVRYRITRY
jgi:hypothetical protein